MKKIFLVGGILLLLTILAVKYFYVPTTTIVNGPTVVATTTPIVNEPKLISGPSISITPTLVQQGEPAIITVEGLTSTSSVKSFTFDNRSLVTFLYNGQVTAFLGVDLRAVPGTYPLVLTLKDGREVREDFVINQRPMLRKPSSIPEKLGGNTPESVKKIISSLAQEGKIISRLPTEKQMLWTEPFRPPLDRPVVVEDPYGYTRVIGTFTMPHKGVDLEASIGTPVYAMNKGVVRFTGEGQNYGKNVVIDHGLGLQTIYMHMSEIRAKNGQKVEKGELIGLSGDTGFVLGPHLHVTVRIWGVSIDPIKFLELLGEKI